MSTTICDLQSRNSQESTYGQILKSSALVGGSSILKIAIGIVRTKALAALLGPSGFGLFSLYGSVSDLWLSISGMGVNSSGVRQIAEAAGSGAPRRIAQTAAVLRWTSVVLGISGAAVLAAFARQVSSLTFGTPRHAAAISLLSLVVLFRLVSDGQGALIQGMRRTSDLARMNVLGALLGLLVSIPLVYFLRENGVVPSLITVAGMASLISWWYSRKIDVEAIPLTFSQIGMEAAALLKLGIVFMSSGMMTLGVAYAVRITILHRIGIEATGLYQSAWALGGLYVGFILQAMGADFYPRLTARAEDDAACNRLVNEQALVGLLLAGPGVIGTLTFAPLIIYVFYSAKFGAAVPVLRWICLGTALQVITWPVGFIIVAKAKRALFFFAEFTWAVFAAALAWLCINSFGLSGAGFAFFGSYVFHAIVVYAIARRLSGFRWSAHNVNAGLLFLPLIAIVFGALYVLPVFFAGALGVVALAVSCYYAIQTLTTLIPVQRYPKRVREVLFWLRGRPERT